MPYGLYISAEGARAQSRRMEVVSNNLANVETVGYKRDVAQFQARFAEAIEQGLDYPGSRSINDIGGGVLLHRTATDYSPGVYEQTGKQTDFAIRGEGFFMIRHGDQDYLTRAGNFQLDRQGFLVTASGHRVLNADDQPLQLDPERPFRVLDGGRIDQDARIVELKLVKALQPGDLVKVGENQFASLGSLVPVAPAERNVDHGYLERAGVQPSLELMELIEASRAFEANVNLIRSQDQVIGSLLNRVLGGRS